jgi:hypothetical protein
MKTPASGFTGKLHNRATDDSIVSDPSRVARNQQPWFTLRLDNVTVSWYPPD